MLSGALTIGVESELISRHCRRTRETRMKLIKHFFTDLANASFVRENSEDRKYHQRANKLQLHRRDKCNRVIETPQSYKSNPHETD